MAEEQRCQEPAGGHRLCANNCGFFGSPTTHNLCSKCFKDHCLKEQQMKEAKLAMETTLTPTQTSQQQPSSSSSSQSPFPESGDFVKVQESKISANNVVAEQAEAPPRVVVEAAAQPNRCATCRKRVGLTGFKCRCGVTFCGTHRYPEQHGCTFDYKAMGKEEIAKANPVVKGEKLDKI